MEVRHKNNLGTTKMLYLVEVSRGVTKADYNRVFQREDLPRQLLSTHRNPGPELEEFSMEVLKCLFAPSESARKKHYVFLKNAPCVLHFFGSNGVKKQLILKMLPALQVPVILRHLKSSH